MTKLFVLSHAAHRFRNDFFPCGTHVRRPACLSCGINLNGWRPPLRYWWDYEFEDPRSSADAGYNCFWGEFRLMVDAPGKALLEVMPIPFTFHPTTMTEGEPLLENQHTLTHATIDISVDADTVEGKNTVCESCGRFTERKRQITRLRIPASDIPEAGIFSVSQNGDHSPMFVTDKTRDALTASGITGIGFYPAGRVI